MNETATVLDVPDAQPAAPEDPLVRTKQDAPDVASCTQDCRQCIVMAVKNRDGKRLSRIGAADLQHAFDRQALGWKRPADEYTSTLVEEEDALARMKDNVKGCHQIANGTRVMTETLLHHSEGLFRERLDREKAMYFNTLARPGAAERAEDPPFVVPPPRETVEGTLGRAWEEFVKKAGAYFA